MNAHVIRNVRQCIAFFHRNDPVRVPLDPIFGNDLEMCECLSFNFFDRDPNLVQQLLHTFPMTLSVNPPMEDKERRQMEYSFLTKIKEDLSNGLLGEYDLHLELIWEKIRDHVQWDKTLFESLQGTKQMYNLCRCAYPHLPIYFGVDGPYYSYNAIYIEVVSNIRDPVTTHFTKPISLPKTNDMPLRMSMLTEKGEHLLREAFQQVPARHCKDIPFASLRPHCEHAWQQWCNTRRDWKQGGIDFFTAYTKGWFYPMIEKCLGYVIVDAHNNFLGRWNVLLLPKGDLSAAFPLSDPLNRYFLEIYLNVRLTEIQQPPVAMVPAPENTDQPPQNVPYAMVFGNEADPTSRSYTTLYRKRFKQLSEIAARQETMHYMRVYETFLPTRSAVNDWAKSSFAKLINIKILPCHFFPISTVAENCGYVAIQTALSWTDWNSQIAYPDTGPYQDKYGPGPKTMEQMIHMLPATSGIRVVSFDEFELEVAKICCSPVPVPLKMIVNQSSRRFITFYWFFVVVK